MIWVELLKDHNCTIQYHPGKANMVADALSRKSSGSLAYISIKRRLMIGELHELLDQGVEFEIISRSFLVHF